jgi:hypothetical protein
MAQRRLHLPSKQKSSWVRVPLPAPIMISACKFCEYKIPTPQLGDSWWCIKCQHYSFVMDSELRTVESESLKVGNYYLNFFPTYKTSTVVEDNEINYESRVIHSLSMNELTHELAVQWVNKLKTYVLFQ